METTIWVQDLGSRVRKEKGNIVHRRLYRDCVKKGLYRDYIPLFPT